MHLLVMAKSPVPGKAKTRLCPPCTHQEAAAIAEAALSDTLTAVAGCGADRHVVALDGAPGAWLPPGFEVIRQGRGPLEVRLAEAWMTVGGPGLQIGMDTPQVSTELLDHCLTRLAQPSVDAVLGLAPDGGWWAIGLLTPRREVFEGVAMSRSDTGYVQQRRLHDLGMHTELLPALRDMDRIEDAMALAAEIPWSRTARAVEAIGAQVSP